MTTAAAAIEVDHVSKRFVLQRRRARDLREVFAARFGRGRNGKAEDGSAFWALRDVSFAIEPGHALGIVGHNGSGKSTMLKLLNGILRPTDGTIRARGRIGALIEVGAGFHPDLTGRENVYLNGSILGLPRREITRKFDTIVGFAGLEKFIDQPVKRYSTGMYMRLGFAIAAHADADILLIDEVLAVGDTQFQNKCLRRMKEFVAQGGTTVFVSHAMEQMADLCDQCVWLDHGQLLYHGPTDEAVERYMELVTEREEAAFKRDYPEEWAIREADRRAAEEERLRREEEERLRVAAEMVRAEEEMRAREAEWAADPSRSRVLGVTLLDRDGAPRRSFQVGEPVRVQIAYRFARALPNPAFCFEIWRSDGVHMFTTSNFEHDAALSDLPIQGLVCFDIPYLSLNPGDYRVRMRLFSEWNEQDWNSCLEHTLEKALEFSVRPGRHPYGITFVPVRWDAEEAEAPRADAAAPRLVTSAGR